MKLIDCHAHLEEVPNLDQELKSAKEKGVAAIIAVGSDLYSNISVQQISEHYPNYVYPALGLHPWDLDRIDETIQFIEKNIERCTALGEVGLDFKYQTPKELQVKAFARILELADRYDKPVIIHSRWAWREAFEMVKKAEIRRAVFHWYSGPLDVLQEILANGYYISATPAAEFSQVHRTAIKETPLERLLLETDSPVKYRGIFSTPGHVLKTLKAVAELSDMDEAKVAEITTKNASQLFGIKI